MKVWSDASSILKVALICLTIGFLLGLCAFGSVRAHSAPDQVG
jgi:hypothetical protein